jgi:hypothetical protein
MENKDKQLAKQEMNFFNATTLDEQYRVATCCVKSGLLPKDYNTPEKVLIGCQFAMELGLKPLTALRQIAVINGTPSIYGDLPLAIVRSSGQLDHWEEYLIDGEGKRMCLDNNNLTGEVFGAVCIVRRRGMERNYESFFTVVDQKTAGLNGMTWTKYKKRMLMYRARSIALKDVFSDCLNGIAISEYDDQLHAKENKRTSNLNQELLS